MPASIRDGGVVRTAQNIFIRDGGVVRTVINAWVHDDGAYRQFHGLESTPPTNCVATDQSAGTAQVQVTWDKGSTPGGDAVWSTLIERNLSGGGFVPFDQVVASQEVYVDDTMGCGVIVQYRVRHQLIGGGSPTAFSTSGNQITNC